MELYLDPNNTQNSNELKTLYLRWQQEKRRTAGFGCGSSSACKAQIYQEVLVEIGSVVARMMEQRPSSSN